MKIYIHNIKNYIICRDGVLTNALMVREISTHYFIIKRMTHTVHCLTTSTSNAEVYELNGSFVGGDNHVTSL